MIKVEKYIVGVDIGGTWIRVAICSTDLRAADIKMKTTRTLKEHEYSISNSVILLISELLTEHDINNEREFFQRYQALSIAEKQWYTKKYYGRK